TSRPTPTPARPSPSPSTTGPRSPSPPSPSRSRRRRDLPAGLPRRLLHRRVAGRTGHGRRVVVVTPYYEDESVTLHHGDALDVLREMPGQSVDCCVTSPPYFGLRSYLPDGVVLRDDLTDDERAYVLGEWRYAVIYSKSQIPEHLHCYFRPAEYGLESSPGEYVETMRALFAEVRRVLADDGTFWLNLGDSYQSSGGKEGVGPNA